MDNSIETLGAVGNGAAHAVEITLPYVAHVCVEGASPLLFHRWDVESVDAKSKAAKGSRVKKMDDLETYVYRNDVGEICVPGEYFRMAMVNAARFVQDPRSPRKSGMDLFKAGVAVLTELCSLGSKEWDYLDRRRVLIQRNGITRVRPAFKTGWRAAFDVQVILPEYIDSPLLQQVLTNAGRFVGVGDFRPTNGRFSMVGYELQQS